MTFILITLIAALLTGVVTLFFSSEMVGELYVTVFDCGKYLTTITGVEFFNLLMPTVYGIGLSLIVLKFLMKAFDIYVLWTDGDPDADPFLLLTNFVRAVGTALVFQWVYGLFVDICQELTDTIISQINDSTDLTTEWVTAITSLGIVPAIAGLIFVICWLILYFSFMARGIEMMVMQAGVPLACVGLLDNDKGVFRAYLNQFVKAFVTTIVQIMLCKIGLSLMLNATILSASNIFWGIACMIAAISMPKILREFLVPTGGDGHVMNSISQTVHITSMAKNIFTK
ncbi:MAG: conjugal transfer protein TrbL family protein [Oscillospiraceae bacterium]